MKTEELMELKESNEDGAILTKAELRRINWHISQIKIAKSPSESGQSYLNHEGEELP